MKSRWVGFLHNPLTWWHAAPRKGRSHERFLAIPCLDGCTEGSGHQSRLGGLSFVGVYRWTSHSRRAASRRRWSAWESAPTRPRLSGIWSQEIWMTRVTSM